jgi:hypothetical protein
VVDLVGGVRRVDGRHDPAGVRDAVEHDGVLGEVGREHGQCLSRLEPAGDQAPGERPDRGEERAVGQGAAARPVDEGRLVAQLAGPRQHEVDQELVGDLDVGQWAGVDHDALLKGPAEMPGTLLIGVASLNEPARSRIRDWYGGRSR